MHEEDHELNSAELEVQIINEQDCYVFEIIFTEVEELVGTVLLSKAPILIPRMLSLDFIEVDEKFRRKGYARRFLHVSRELAADRGFDGVVPHPDLSRDGASFWDAVDPKALRSILRHDGARERAIDNGCDPEHFDEIVEAFA
jgi:GNAT superfamily N-acetyltransferase